MWWLMACAEVHDHLTVAVDRALLPVEVHGDEASETMVLVESGGPSGPSIAQRAVGLHPFQATLETWAKVAWYDRRGTGNASGDYAPADQSVEQLLTDLDAVVTVLDERYRPRRLIVLGHSFGAWTAARYALDRPGRLDGLVLAAPAVLGGDDAAYVPYRRDFLCRLSETVATRDEPRWAEIASFCDAYPAMEADLEAPGREALWRHLTWVAEEVEPWTPLDAGGLLSSVFGSSYNVLDASARGNLISAWINPGREDLLTQLPALDLPTVVVTGELDGLTPTELGVAAALAADGVAVDIAGGGHGMMADDPEAFDAAVRSGEW